jgi:pimeloyl-ACP methyl ester carboxylesterase
LLLHGARDKLIRVTHSERLKAQRPDAELVVVQAAGHADIHGAGAYREALERRLAELAPQGRVAPLRDAPS